MSGWAPTVRRLLVATGVVGAWWLLGTAGPAHAGTTSASAADAPHAVLAMAADGTGAEARLPIGDRAVPRSRTNSGALPEPLARSAHHAVRATEGRAAARTSVPGASSPHETSGGLTRTMREAEHALPFHPSTVIGRPGAVWRAVTDVASIGPSSGDTGTGHSWTPWRRERADAGNGDRAGARAAGPFAASGASKSGRAVFHAAFSHPAPVPGVDHPDPLPVRAGTPLLAGGQVQPGGGIAHLEGTGAGPRLPFLRTPLPRVVAPALRAATDEPSFSPD
jgi:hypothetical protein